MKQFKAKILSNKKIAPDHHSLSFAVKNAAGGAKPGQFFNVKVDDSYDPLLRRPFGAHRIRKDRIDIMYKVVGKATSRLASRKKGDMLDILGPLGNGFILPSGKGTSSLPGREEVVLVAGGHGIAPLLVLAEKIQDREIVVIIGARTKNHIVCENDFRKLGAKVFIATEDGTKGHKGRVTDVLKEKLDRQTIYACGPKPMLRSVAKLAGQHGIPCQVSFEEYMACGIGTCLGCPVETDTGYKLVCKDGPVFDAKEILW